MPTNPLHLVINGRCTWCQGPHDPGPLDMTIDDITETRYGTTQHMHWPVDADTRRRLAAVIRQGDERLSWQRRLVRWLKRT